MTELITLDELNSKLKGKSPRQIKVIAKETANSIMAKIEAVLQSIKEAKDLSIEAENSSAGLTDIVIRFVTFGWFGESATEKRSKLNTKAISMQNQAMAEMNDIIKQSVNLTLCSTDFAESMIDGLRLIVENGFKDAYGNIQQLSDYSKKLVILIIEQAKEAKDRQAQSVARANEQDAKIAQNSENISILQDKFAQKDTLDALQDSLIAENRKLIEQNLDKHTQSEKRDKDQDEKIIQNRENISALQGRFTQKDTLDTLQDSLITENRKLIEQNKEMIEGVIKSRKSGALAFFISLLALILGIVNLGLFFTK